MQHRPQSPSATVRGRWHGEIGDPQRFFEGQVTDSSVPSLRVGSQIKVTFDAPAHRPSGVDEQGTYTLQTSADTLKLMSFTNMTEATGGKQDTEAAYWQATPLPE